MTILEVRRHKLKLTLRCKLALWLCPGICPSLPEKEAITELEEIAQQVARNKIKKRCFTQMASPKYHAKRKRTKFKKRWPHGKHSG